VTVLEVIQRSTEFLARKGVDSPRLQIELLLAHVLQMPRLKLYLNFERPLSEEQVTTLRELVRRRGDREPLQHLLGTVNFLGLELAVTRDVLIPRPETEQLVELAAKHFAARNAGQAQQAHPIRVLDFGTGSGCVAVALAKQFPGAEIHATDLSEAALRVAQENAARQRVTDRVQFHLGDGFSAVPAGIRFDLLVSNPPYIPGGEIAALQPEVRDHDPRLALDGGTDGLDFYRRFVAEAPAFLQPDARLVAEFGDGQETALVGLFAAPGWSMEAIEKDLSGRARFMVARCV
jgi:release factor glutamine methyltransferase